MTSPTVRPAGRDEDDLHRFLEKLLAMSLDDWLQIAMTLPAEVAPPLEHALSRALDERVTAFDVWSARDDVSAILHRFQGGMGRVLVRTPDTLKHIQRVTERAALAVLARGALSLSEYDALTGAFRDVASQG